MVSEEEKDILIKLATGNAKAINLSKASLYQHLGILKAKFGATDRANLIYLAMKKGAIV